MCLPSHVLLIEDDAAHAALVQQMLETHSAYPFSVMRTESLADGLAEARSGLYAAVLLDLDLPDSEGLDTLRTCLSELKHLPVVVMLGEADDTAGLAAMRVGAQDYVVKGPECRELLVRALIYAIERDQMVRLLRRQIAVQQKIFDALPVPFLRIDAGGLIIGGNRAAAERLETSAEALIGRRPKDVLSPEAADYLTADGGGESKIRFTAPIAGADGRIVDIHLRRVPLADEEGPLGVLAVFGEAPAPGIFTG